MEKRLPEPVRRIVAESVDIVDRDEFGMDGEDGGEESDTAKTGIDAGEATTKPDRRDLPPVLDRLTARQFTFGAIAGYVGVAYVLSILVATPLFVLTYGYWNRQPRWAVVGLTVVSIGICLLFMSIANAPLDRSLLFPRGMF
ncbi:tripartite tricarboxylate transporter TctB family protein [Natronobacterium haloterrestre]|nr:tripartite tricarboxylate transporter TctB family protein [Halobiforma haloterrestris]